MFSDGVTESATLSKIDRGLAGALLLFRGLWVYGETLPLLEPTVDVGEVQPRRHMESVFDILLERHGV
jgi:hypothetical protein